MENARVMKDSYVGGISSSSCIQQDDDSPFSVTISEEQTAINIPDDKIDAILFGGKTKGLEMQRANQTDEDKIIHLTCTDEAKSTNINKTEEYNIDYSGLSILPWEEFVLNPRSFNDLFYTERNQKITYDPEEVNVFFHGKNVMPPTIGDISENGRSWNIEIDTIADLRKVRKMLTERCSVFGVTIVYKEKRFAKPVRVPCLVLMDPNQGGIGDRLYTTLTKAMDTIHNQRRFCVEINLNICVERWCKRVLLTDCKAVGAKLFVTNGEEYTPLNESTEDMICCALCFPIWLLQTCIYKLHRFTTYDDYRSDLDAEDLFLHGSFQDAHYQRQQIFKETNTEEVFRTRCANQTDTKTLQELGTYKFVCVKKVKKTEDENNFKEHNTAPFSSLVDKRKQKVLDKDRKICEKKSKKEKSNKDQSVKFDLGDNDVESDETRNDGADKETGMEAYTNETFTLSDEQNAEEIEATPRIPEIESVLCSPDNEEADEIEVPIDMDMRNENVFVKTVDSVADSMDQDVFDYPLSTRELHDTKSMTAVCSFQINSESEADLTDEDSEDEEKSKEIPVSSNKDDFLLEMKKIEGTLPTLQAKLIESEENDPKDEPSKGKKGKKSKKKIMIGQAFREITKTTNKASIKDFDCKDDEEETKADKEKSRKIENKLDESEKSVAKESELKIAESESFKTIELKNDSPSNSKSKNKDNYIDAAAKTDIKSPKNTKGERNAVKDFNFDSSSSDGDDVEMIYQSKNENCYISSYHDNENTETKLEESVKDIEEHNIEEIADENISKYKVNSKSKFQKPIMNTKPLTGSDDESDEKSGNTCNENEHNGNKTIKAREKLESYKVHEVTKVEEPLDITDIDDINESDDKQKQNTKIPPLKLNIGENLGKKAKRGSRQYNSNRRYLGASLPSKTRRIHRE